MWSKELTRVFRVKYEKINSSLYLVECFAFGQRIVLSKSILISKIGMSSNCVLGCMDLDVYEIIDLGFILPASVVKKVD